MTVSARTATPITLRTARRWAYENLFSSPANVVLTVVTSAVIGFAFFGVARFVLASADWEVVATNRRLFFVGRFPEGDLFRVWIAVYILAGMSGWSLGLWSKPGLRAAAVLAILLIPVFFFIGLGSVTALTGGAVGLFALTHVFARVVLAPTRFLDQVRTLTIVGWIVAFSVAMFVLGDVPRLLWGGLLLTLILALVGIVASFPLGMLLALGRASTFPAIRIICVGYIEVIRGVPLITLLFMAQFILPLMIEPERNLSIFGLDISVFGQEVPLTGYEMDNVIRALAAITLFSAAYLAEIIRGGLQAVPRGQVEAAKALGLSTTRILAFIVLPQALRAVIPAIVGQFISLFKDTSLVAVAGLTDLLGVTRQVTAQQDFIGRQAEVLLFAALIYWIVAFSMSRASQQLERNLGVGER
ncbi:MAG: amino acid ABC transporter permease [Chloroflexi bacterium]|nr:amino acid ABC transporter permease [Chloroflexota bacterium]